MAATKISSPDQYRRRDEALVPRLRHERNRGPRSPRYSRRTEAGASPHPLHDAADGSAAQPAHAQMRPHRRRRNGQISSARQSRCLRRVGASGAAVRHALSRWWRAREISARSMATRPRPIVTPKPGCRAFPRRCWKTWISKRSISSRTTTRAKSSRKCCRRAFRICW